MINLIGLEEFFSLTASVTVFVGVNFQRHLFLKKKAAFGRLQRVCTSIIYLPGWPRERNKWLFRQPHRLNKPPLLRANREAILKPNRQLILGRSLAIGPFFLGRPKFLVGINLFQLHEAGGLLGVFAHLPKLRHSHGDKQSDDGHHDHDFHKCETGCSHFFGLHFIRRIHVFAGGLVTKPRRLSTPAVMGKPQIFSKVAPLGQALGLLTALCQVVASNLVVVSEIDAPVGKCGVGPD